MGFTCSETGSFKKGHHMIPLVCNADMIKAG